MSAVLQINPELQAKFETLAHTTHRDSKELVNEALEFYLETDRITQAKRGEFMPDAEMEAFFAQHADPE